MPDNPRVIAYGRGAPAGQRRRRTLILLAVLVALAAVAVTASFYLPPYYDQWTYLQAQKAIALPVLGEDVIVYTDDPRHLNKVEGRTNYGKLTYATVRSGSLVVIPQGSWPTAIRYFQRDTMPDSFGTASFGRVLRGQLTSPGETTRIIDGDFVQDIYTFLTYRLIPLYVRTTVPATLTPGERAVGKTRSLLRIELGVADRLTLYAGTPDPADPARIRFWYDLNGQRGEAEIRLADDGSLTARAVTGKLQLMMQP